MDWSSDWDWVNRFVSKAGFVGAALVLFFAYSLAIVPVFVGSQNNIADAKVFCNAQKNTEKKIAEIIKAKKVLDDRKDDLDELFYKPNIAVLEGLEAVEPIREYYNEADNRLDELLGSMAQEEKIDYKNKIWGPKFYGIHYEWSKGLFTYFIGWFFLVFATITLHFKHKATLNEIEDLKREKQDILARKQMSSSRLDDFIGHFGLHQTNNTSVYEVFNSIFISNEEDKIIETKLKSCFSILKISDHEFREMESVTTSNIKYCTKGFSEIYGVIYANDENSLFSTEQNKRKALVEHFVTKSPRLAVNPAGTSRLFLLKRVFTIGFDKSSGRVLELTFSNRILLFLYLIINKHCNITTIVDCSSEQNKIFKTADFVLERNYYPKNGYLYTTWLARPTDRQISWEVSNSEDIFKVFLSDFSRRIDSNGSQLDINNRSVNSVADLLGLDVTSCNKFDETTGDLFGEHCGDISEDSTRALVSELSDNCEKFLKTEGREGRDLYE